MMVLNTKNMIGITLKKEDKGSVQHVKHKSVVWATNNNENITLGLGYDF